MSAPTAEKAERRPFWLIDRVLTVSETSIVATRTFRAEEDFFRGHFPGRPIVPGVLLLDAMAQAMALWAREERQGASVSLSGIERARFRHPVLPGQDVEIALRLEAGGEGLLTAAGTARVAGVRVAEARLCGRLGSPLC